mgnify:CR=1 FL=1
MQRRTAVERGMTLKAIDEARRLLSSEAFTETAVLLSGGTDLAEAYRTRLLVKNVIPKHLDCISAKLVEMGVDVEEQDDAVLVRRSGPITRTNVKTMPYPGFPTDMQPQMYTDYSYQ